MSDDLASPSYIGDLGGGLIRRWSTAADTEKFALLLGTVFRDDNDDLPNPRPMAEARLLMRPGFPYMTADDVAVVEDTSRPDRPLVASTTFWRHTWSYAGIPFGVTRPELVAADPTYRNRGLIRAVFEMIHARGAAEGHLLQGITGIPYFYRQFGYEYVLDLDGSRTTYFSLIPEKKGDEPEFCTLRRAGLDDVERITAIYNLRRSSSLLRHESPEERLRWVIAFWDDPEVRDQDVLLVGSSGRYWMILNADQEICGYAWIAARRWSRSLLVRELGLVPGADVQRMGPALLRALRDYGLTIPAVRSDAPPCSEIEFSLGRLHPFYDVLGDALAPKVTPPYAWYIRIPDVPAFLRLITPALEERVAQSALVGYTGDLKIDHYRGGLRLRFEQGKLVDAAAWRPPIQGDEDTALGCPPLTFLQLLLGYRGLDELRAIFPDIWVKDEYRLLMTTLFPKQHSVVEPFG